MTSGIYPEFLIPLASLSLYLPVSLCQPSAFLLTRPVCTHFAASQVPSPTYNIFPGRTRSFLCLLDVRLGDPVQPRRPVSGTAALSGPSPLVHPALPLVWEWFGESAWLLERGYGAAAGCPVSIYWLYSPCPLGPIGPVGRVGYVTSSSLGVLRSTRCLPSCPLSAGIRSQAQTATEITADSVYQIWMAMTEARCLIHGLNV